MQPSPVIGRCRCVLLTICLVTVAAINTASAGQFEGQDRPDTNRPGPWDNDVLVSRVGDSGVTRLATFERAGVPTVARLTDGRLIAAHQYFPENVPADFDKVAVRFSLDEGKTWTAPKVIQLAGLPEGMRFPFDPTLVPLPDGKVRLYFTSVNRRSFIDHRPAIYSAISSNGSDYVVEPGVRFEVAGRPVIDCAVVLHQGQFHLFALDNGAGGLPGPNAGAQREADRPRMGVGYHATSRDGLTFQRENDVNIEGRRRWLGNAQSDGKVIHFFGTGEPGIWTATSENGVDWKLGRSLQGVMGADPGAVQLRDGAWLVVATGPPRAGTASVRQFGQRGNDGRGNPQPPGNPPLGPRSEPGRVQVQRVDSKYAVAPVAPRGTFVTGQPADLMLGGIDFNNSGGPLLFNHPSGLATDGTRLLVCDRFNNRVLIWNTLPASNVAPDVVLGQPDFTANNPGVGRNQLNWPGNVAIAPDGTHIAVADTYNDRVLLWTTRPDRHGTPANLVLDLQQLTLRENDFNPSAPQQRWAWPWGVWTDGKKLAVVATHGSAVLIWNAIPTRDHQLPDFVLHPRDSGTPRNVTSDGNFFALSDHNYGPESRPATMAWRTFPTHADQPPDFLWREWTKGTITPDRKLLLAGMSTLYVWDRVPTSADIDADVVLRPRSYANGDGPDIVQAGGRVYVCNYNGNNILVWNNVPSRDDEPPAFAIGSDSPDQNTLKERFFLMNPVVATDGKSLFVSSDFERKLFVWRSLPDQSGAKPDVVTTLPDAAWDNALHGQTLVLAGKQSVFVWNKLPLDGEPPDATFTGGIGSVRFRELTGVAYDGRRLYLADRSADAIYVWEGIPTRDAEPLTVLDVAQPGRLSSDGEYLAVAPFTGQKITIFRVADRQIPLSAITLGGPGQFNLPGKCVVAHGALFVADTSFNRVHVWHRTADALAGKPADALLGARDNFDRTPEIGRDNLFMPGTIAFDGGYLWVGEFKFSSRLLRFSPQMKRQDGIPAR